MVASNFSRILWAASLLVWSAPVAPATIIDITGTIRDFRDSHADMEAGIVSMDPGMVETTLGADGKPVYAGRPGTLTTSGRENFDHWFRDVPGLNQSKPLTISLDNTITSDPSVYTFSDSAFFPIDDELFGNEGRIHNYHFTFELSTQFTYQPGQSFTFTGDDDVFVFINKKLAIDLGGVHAAQTSTADLDILGLTAGNNYDLDIFFAERQTVESNFRIDTSILLDVLDPSPVPDNGATFTLLGMAAWGLLRMRRRLAIAS